MTTTEAQHEVNQVLLNSSSGWNLPQQTQVLSFSGIFLNDNYLFQGQLIFYFRQTGGIMASADTSVFLSVDPQIFVLFVVSGFIAMLWVLWSIVSLRSLYFDKPIRWLELISCILWIIGLGLYMEIQSNIDVLQVSSFCSWQDASIKFNLFGDSTKPFPEQPALSNTLTTAYVTQMMWIWRIAFGFQMAVV